MSNRLKEAWQDGRTTLNGWLSVPSPLTTEVMALAGWDSLTIDMQHGLIGYPDLLSMLQAMHGTSTVPLVRVPWNEPGIIMRALDSGALGVICPMINSRAEAEAFVSACRFPPMGRRSFGPARAIMIHGSDYVDRADRIVLALAMIETQEAVANLDAILATPGLDGIYIGPSDLGMSMGLGPAPDRTDSPIFDVIKGVLEMTREAGLRAGIHTSSVRYARLMADIGFDMVTIGNDLRLLVQGARQTLTDLRQGLEQRKPTTGG